MLNEPVLFTKESQVKSSIWSKTVIVLIFEPYKNLKPDVHMKRNNNILVTFSIL